jgi:hypothetical protein
MTKFPIFEKGTATMRTTKLIRHLAELYYDLPSPEAPEFAKLAKEIGNADKLDDLIVRLSRLRDAVFAEHSEAAE